VVRAPNAALAYRVLDHIDAHPEQWRQNWWFTQRDCGTAACFAGWACVLSGDQPRVTDADEVGEFSTVIRPDGALANVEDRAEALLGLDGDKAGALFYASNTRADLDLLVIEIFGPRPVDWDKPLEPVMGVPASGCDCSHDGGHGLAPWPDRSQGHAEDCPAFGPRPTGGEGGSSEATS
jgi:hypothetical protein